MLEKIKALEAAGQWADLLQLAETLPQGDALARVFIALSKLQEDAAQNGAEYRQALSYARRAITAAEQGSLMWTWAQGRTAALASDLGDYRLAEQAAGEFLGALPHHDRAQILAPWVHFHLGRVRHAQRQYEGAAALFRQAEAADTGAISERARLHLVWTLAEAGQIGTAMAALPSAVVYISAGHLSAARAVVMAAAGDWAGARTEALAALRTRSAGEWAVYDTVQAAELLLILKHAALHEGSFRQAVVWHLHSAALLCGWNAGLLNALLPTLPQEGGVWNYAAASSCGPAGYRRTGLLGVVG